MGQLNSEDIDRLTKAVEDISHGGGRAPMGLEAVAMAIAGNALNSPAGESLGRIADALHTLSEVLPEAIYALAKAVRERNETE
jgi:hypothetical protein